MGRFDFKFNNNGDIHPSAHGVFMELHSQDTATFKNLFSNPFNVMFINKNMFKLTFKRVQIKICTCTVYANQLLPIHQYMPMLLILHAPPY
jgi:hypothetical protein